MRRWTGPLALLLIASFLLVGPISKVLPERSGYYLGLRLVEGYLAERGLASTARASAAEFKTAEERALGIQSA